MNTAQIPQHVASQLAHLTSRPGIQSTLILSRKDGSIIQATGKLAASSNDNTSASTSTTIQPLQPSPNLDQDSQSQSTNESTDTLIPSEPAPYKPTQAETLASHIYSFVASASALSASLSAESNADNTEYETRDATRNGLGNGTGDSNPNSNNENENGVPERDDEDEVKLLRLRTKIHEIIIIPDKRFLLCVVHDVSSGTGGSSGHSR